MDLEEAVKIGFLLVPPQNFLRKTWLKRYCAIYNSSNHGIQRIELFESEEAFVKQNPSKIIPLTDCIKVSPTPQKNQPNVFEVRTKNNMYQFSTDTFQNMTDWLSALQSVAFGKRLPKLSSGSSFSAKDEKQEENLLYSSMEEPEIYPVKAVSTEATQRNKLVGDYKLIITPVNLSISEDCSQGRMGRIIFTWPYRHIRRYGCTTENFSFEAGRKCTSGEGLFTFTTTDGKLIFDSVDAHVLALKSSQNEFDMPSSPSLNADKNFFTSKDSLMNKTFHPVVDKLEQTFKATHGNDNEASSFQNKTFQKPVAYAQAPLSKPPRRSLAKTTKSTYGTPNISAAKDMQNEDSKFSPNMYVELYTGNSNQAQPTLEQSGLPQPTYDNCEQLNSGGAEEKFLCYSTDKLQIATKEQDPSSVSSLDYENCDRFFSGKVTVSKPVDHVYGKLLNTKQTISSGDSSNKYGAILPKLHSTPENSSSHVYSNVSVFPKSSASRDSQRDPLHFVKSGAEYAQGFQKEKALLEYLLNYNLSKS